MFGKKPLKRAAMALALTAAGLGAVTTAEARDRYYRDRGGNDAAIAIGAGIVGLAIGALLGDRDDRYYRDSRYYSQRRYVRVNGYPGHYYYYANNPRRYYRDRYYDRYYGNYYSRNRYDRYDRRYRDRHYNDGYYGDGYYGDRSYRYRSGRNYDYRWGY